MCLRHSIKGQAATLVGPCGRLYEGGSALLWFLKAHKNLFGGRCGGVFQSLQFFAGLETHRLARRNADFFAGARIPSNAGLARLDAEDAEFAKFDALAAAQSALQRFEDGLDGLFRFRAADICLGHHSIYDVELDHTTLQESVARC